MACLKLTGSNVVTLLDALLNVYTGDVQCTFRIPAHGVSNVDRGIDNVLWNGYFHLQFKSDQCM